MQWTTGDFSGGNNRLGGTEALAGINAGDSEIFITIPGSLTPSIINITQTTNVGIPGVWIFRVDHCKYVMNFFEFHKSDKIMQTLQFVCNYNS